MVMTGLADKFLNFEYLTDKPDAFTGAFFDYDFNQAVTSTQYDNPTFSIIENITPTASAPWIDSSLSLVEFPWGVSNYVSDIFCNAFTNWSLFDYEIWSELYWIWRNPIESQWEEWTWTQYNFITCQFAFDHSVFQSQQLYEIKQFSFYLMLVIFLWFAYYIIKPFIFSRNDA